MSQMIKHSILISNNLTNDFARPIGPRDSLPNPYLHIGYQETKRIFGDNWKTGHLINFLKSAEKTKKLTIIHIRDWHNPKDPNQKEELEHFGNHCLAGTDGANFIWANSKILDPKRYITFNSTSLYELSEKKFMDTIKKITKKYKKNEVNIGIIGVLTDIKIKSLAVGLKHFLKFPNVAVCAALTASNDYRNHLAGLKELENNFIIHSFRSIADFQEFLGIKSSPVSMPRIKKYGKLKISEKQTEEIEKIFEYLYRDCSKIYLKQLKGGFTASKIFLVNSFEGKIKQFPTVVKIDSRENIGKEEEGYYLLKSKLGSHMPNIAGKVELKKKAGIKMELASMSDKNMPIMLMDVYASAKGLGEFKKTFRKILYEILGDLLYKNTSIVKSVQLFQHYGFTEENCRLVEKNIQNICSCKKSKIKISGNIEIKNPMDFYRNIKNYVNRPQETVVTSDVHGDLNWNNILIDANKNIWIIDFRNSGNFHVLMDVAKLENDVKFILTELNSEKDLEKAFLFEKILMKQNRFGERLPALPKRLNKFLKLYETIKIIRKFAGSLVSEKTLKNYHIALLRYSGHTLGFDKRKGKGECNPYQLKYALISTGLLAEKISNI